ncbi:MAG: adaptor protein MecA [Eubacteriales bacterium]|nr:adaptor protein MecA [Eubacteriales bacterium]
MEIEKLSENVIKVTITPSDLEERDIDLDSLTYNSPEAKELFFDMIEQAEMELGFSVSESQVVIEPSTEEYDGFVITITRLDDKSDFDSLQKLIKSKSGKSKSKAALAGKILRASLVYYTESFDDMCLLCDKLSAVFKGKSSLYGNNGKYYLVLGKEKFSSVNVVALMGILEEYALKTSSSVFYEGYLNEYGTLIIKDDAIPTIIKHFK